MLPIDRTNLTAAQTNQVPNALIRSALNIAAIQTPYDTIDELYNRFNAFTVGYNRFIDGGMFTETGIANTYDGGAF